MYRFIKEKKIQKIELDRTLLRLAAMDDLLKRIAQSSRRLATAEREIQSRGAAGASPTTVSLSHLGSVESTRGRARVCVSLLLKLHRSSLDRALAGRQLST